MKLPLDAAGTTILSDKASGASVEFKLVGAARVGAHSSDGYLVYDRGYAPGAHMFNRPSPEGTEDFVLFEEAPEHAWVDYRFTIGPGVAGLRLVANSLELVDAHGAPRIRVPSPVAYDARGTLAATLSVDDCNVDRSAAPPWGRAPVPPAHAECTLRVSWAQQGASYPLLVDPSWTTTGSMSVARADFPAATLPNGRVLAAGGSVPPWAVAFATSELFDPATRTWALTGSMLSARSGSTMHVLSNGKVLVAGGYDPAVGALASAELFDPATGIWSATGAMAEARYAMSTVSLPDGRPLVAGGDGNTAAWTLATAEIYDPGTALWASAGTMASEHGYGTATLLSSGKVLVAGGWNDSLRETANADLYDPALSSWSAVAPMPLARGEGHFAAPLPNNRALVGGGYTETGPIGVEQGTHIFDATSGVWSAGPAMGTPRAAPASARLADGSIVVAGGQSAHGAQGYTNTATAERFDATENLWVSLPPLSSARRYPGSAVLHGGMQLLVMGGEEMIGPDATLSAGSAASDLLTLDIARADSPDPPAIGMTWLTSPATYDSTQTIDIRIENIGTATRDVEIFLVGRGLDSRFATRTLTSVALAGGATHIRSIPLADLPVQSVGTQSQIEVHAKFTNDDGGSVTVPSETLYTEFNAAYDRVTLYGANGKNASADVNTEDPNVFLAQSAARSQQLFEVTGRVFDNGAFLPVSELPPQGQLTVRTMQTDLMNGHDSGRYDHLYPLIRFPGDQIPQVPLTGPRVCATWGASYVDTDRGEDFLLRSTANQHKAAYAAALLTKADNTPIWKGPLDVAGCTPRISLEPGDYVIWYATKLSNAGRTIDIRYTTPTPVNSAYPFPGTIRTGFRIQAGSAAAVIQPFTTMQDSSTRVAAAIGQALGSPDNGVVAGPTLTVFSNQDCGPNPDGPGRITACAGGDYLRIGPNPIPTPHNSRYKHVILHEFGHIVQEWLMGTPGRGYAGTDTLVYKRPENRHLCNCDAVEDEGRRGHCLNSLEYDTDAQSEGWAHFYAAKILNNRSESDCAFIYYKNFPLDRTSPPYLSRLEEPVYRSCDFPVTWLEAKCEAPGEQHIGVEWDWLGFFRRVNVVDGAKASAITDLAAIYRIACGGGSCDRKPGAPPIAVHYSDLADAADIYYASPFDDDRRAHFSLMGNLYGVNH